MARERFIIKFSISKYRKRHGKIKMPPKPIKRSKYAEELFTKGAGWRG